MSKESLHLKKTERYARFLDSADQIFWEWNLKANEFRVSDRIEAILGYKHGEIPGHEGEEILMPREAWAAFIHPDDLARTWESIEHHLEGLAPMHEAEVRYKTKSGGWKWLLAKGRIMGDLLLQEAATRLERCVRDSDTVARLGGDEFTVILPELHDPGNVDRVAQHILRALVDPISLNDELAYVSGSIGITFFPNDATDVEELIRNADQAMYAAKHSGKNQYHYFMAAMQEAAQKRMRLANDLRSALENDQFDVVYQPIVEISTGVIRKAEALIRWQHPIKGLINPVDFISAAEDTGMISAFGDWIFYKAAKQAAIWREKHQPDFQISVNISPAQFRREGIDPAAWSCHLREICLPGKGIVVEITEGLLLDASSKVTDQLMMLRDAGIEVALDDFGTGYSSLAYLKKFNIDYIKIDRIFVTNLAEGSDDMALCKAIVFLAHQLGLQVIAEGVETKEQHALLASSGCDFAQGYLFSRPLPPRDFEQLLCSQPFLRQWTEPFSIRPGDKPLPYT